MTRDEFERCGLLLLQGLDLDRATQKRLVWHALGAAGLQPHRNGCGFKRGEECTCREGTARLDLAVKEALSK